MAAAQRRFWVGGNFKMNGSRDSLRALVLEFNRADLDEHAGDESEALHPNR